MKIDQVVLQKNGSKRLIRNDIVQPRAVQLVLVFGIQEILLDSAWLKLIQSDYPTATVVSCSSDDVFIQNEVLDHVINYTAIHFEKTSVKHQIANISEYVSSFELGKMLMRNLPKKDLSGMLVFSDGQLVNGSELLDGINTYKPDAVLMSGGMASDDTRFTKTFVGVNDLPIEGNVILIGLYGSQIRFGHGSKAGWDHFGPKRKITKSIGNTLFELDNQNALDLYKKYLGIKANDLPGSALFFPLALQIDNSKEVLIRTILNIDEESKSMVFAGAIPEGEFVQFMKTNKEHLIDGAQESAQLCKDNLACNEIEFALVMSCIGRKMVLGQLVGEEIDRVSNTFGRTTVLTGIFSYGEIGPLVKSSNSELHNQTMTIVTMSEV